MSEKSDSSIKQTTVRFSRVVHPIWAIGLGISITIGLSVLILLRYFLDLSASGLSFSYLIAGVIFIPIVLTYGELSATYRQRKGLFNILSINDAPELVYSSEWITLGGYISLAALLGQGAGIFINTLIAYFFNVSIEIRFLTPAIIALIAVGRFFGRRAGWRLTSAIAFGCILFLIIISGQVWLSPEVVNAVPITTKNTGNTLYVFALMSAALWSINIVINHQREIQKPTRLLQPILLTAVISATVLAFIVAGTLISHPALTENGTLPIASLAGYKSELFELIYLVLGALITLTSLDWMMISSLRLVGLMTRDGFLPSQLQTTIARLRTPSKPLAILTVVIALAAGIFPTITLSGLSAFTFLLTTIILTGKSILKPFKDLSEERLIKLPFPPLFPGLSVSICAFLLLVLPLYIWLNGLIWLSLGGLYYLLFARRGNIAARRQDQVIGDIAPPTEKTGYRVLVSVTNPKTAASLIQAGALIAKARKGQVLVINIVNLPEQVPTYLKKQAARDKLQSLHTYIEDARVENIQIEPIVRLAPSPASGLIETVREEKIDLILMGRTIRSSESSTASRPILERVARGVSCEIAVLHGSFSGPIKKVVVPTAGGPHAPAALRLGESLTQTDNGQIVAVNIITARPTPDNQKQAKSNLESTVAGAENPDNIERTIIHATDVRQSILEQVENEDLLLLGASTKGLLDQTVFAGLPAEVAKSRSGPTLLVKPAEGVREFWLRRFSRMVYAPTPTLTVGERGSVHTQMFQAARAGADFYSLIIMAAMIAFLGLVQNSGAIIIGAMLVAPLMSPILAMANSIVQGNLDMLTTASESTVKGTLLTIGVAIAMAIILPYHSPTHEILSRTQPNFLDLLVALASGAAAAYAISKKKVTAAALPGVAIAAALVPPLCVAGYGIGSSQFALAGGALLLFAANLSAIILAGAGIFLLLGFRPSHAGSGKQMRRAITLTLVSMLVIAIPLGLTSINSRNQIKNELQLETLFIEAVQENSAQVEDVTIKFQRDKYLINGTIYTFTDFNSDQIYDIQEHLNQVTGLPITVQVKVLNASLIDTDEEYNPIATQQP